MKSVRWLASYILVASLGLWLAFAVSSRFMTPARSQNAPANGDLPADFLKEVESTQVPATTPAGTPPNTPPNTQPPGPTATPDQPPAQLPPTQNPAPPTEPSTIPPPPANAAELPIDDGMTAPSSVPAFTPNRDGYVYDPSGKRDPFRPFRTVRPVIEKTVEALAPLQRYELQRLQVVGILWDVGTPRAMIRDPDGAVHTIVKNSKMGRAEGFVAAIREGEIVVVETRYEDGKSFKETRVLELKK